MTACVIYYIWLHMQHSLHLLPYKMWWKWEPWNNSFQQEYNVATLHHHARNVTAQSFEMRSKLNNQILKPELFPDRYNECRQIKSTFGWTKVDNCLSHKIWLGKNHNFQYLYYWYCIMVFSHVMSEFSNYKPMQNSANCQLKAHHTHLNEIFSLLLIDGYISHTM